MNPDAALACGALLGMLVGTLAFAALGLWGIPVTCVATLAGIAIGERL